MLVLSCASMCAVLSGYTGTRVLIMCPHVRSVERIRWSVYLPCASLHAVLSGYAGAGVLVMCQHVRSAERTHWSECAYHVPACAQC